MNDLYMKRIIIGKSIGFIVGLMGFLSIPYVFPDASMMMQIGILLWYTLLGAVIAMAGTVDGHPLFKFRLNSCVRGAVLGASMSLILVLIAYDSFNAILQTSTWFAGLSPFWFILEGAVIGLGIDVIATKKTGEGVVLCAKL